MSDRTPTHHITIKVPMPERVWERMTKDQQDALLERMAFAAVKAAEEYMAEAEVALT
jgi:hypothetical protein